MRETLWRNTFYFIIFSRTLIDANETIVAKSKTNVTKTFSSASTCNKDENKYICLTAPENTQEKQESSGKKVKNKPSIKRYRKSASQSSAPTLFVEDTCSDLRNDCAYWMSNGEVSVKHN